MVYINFYFKELKMNDNIVKGVFDSPDNDVYCKFEYDINTRQFKIFEDVYKRQLLHKLRNLND